MTQISKDLGVSVNTLINWKKRYLTDYGYVSHVLSKRRFAIID
ncbi:hypothetical protein [Leptospira weilii]